MSIDSTAPQEQEEIPKSRQTSLPLPPNSKTSTSTSPKDHESNPTKENSTSLTSSTSSSNLISSILSPFSSLLSNTSTNTPTKDSESENKKDEKSDSEPTPYFAPNEVPKFKALMKKRLSGTRTKQLLKAAGRAFDDPPPPPELGSCCGSSCDPCVNDLWREEREVWRERWGDRRVEKDGGVRKDLEW